MHQLVHFLESKLDEGIARIKCFDLITRSNASPLSDGLACLAAVPPQARKIVPEPYQSLVEPSRSADFERLWDSCFHPEHNAFDIQLFQRRCQSALAKIESSYANISSASNEIEQQMVVSDGDDDSMGTEGRKIRAGNKFWTIISLSNAPLDHPFEPPEPFSNRLSKLRKSKRIKATKLRVKAQIKSSDDTAHTQSKKISENESNIHNMPYRVAFRKRK